MTNFNPKKPKAIKRPGHIFAIPLPGGKYGFGLQLKEDMTGIYRNHGSLHRSGAVFRKRKKRPLWAENTSDVQENAFFWQSVCRTNEWVWRITIYP